MKGAPMKLDEGNVELSSIARDILAYLIEHAESQDTLEGIMQWWLLEQDIKRWIDQVQAAIAELVARGLVLERRGRDGRIHYRINRSRKQKIKTLIEREP
jgi:hypothetical protein